MTMKRTQTPLPESKLARRDFIRLGAGAGAITLTAMNVTKAFAQETLVPGWEIRPRGASQPVSIDVHTHWTPEGYAKRLAQLGRPMAGSATANPLRADLDKRIKWMDEHGVQMLVLTLSGGMPWQWVSPKEGARLAQIVNDAAMEAHAAFPDRFIAGVEISVRDPDLCVKEIDRAAGKPGMRGVHLPNSLEGRDDYVFEPSFAPVLARCQELGLPLLFHPLDGEVNYYGGSQTRLGGPLADSVRYWNTLGFTFETATSAAKFITTGTLDKFPRLDIVLPHSGGSFPYLAGRVEHGLARKKFPLQHPFRDYIRRFHYDTMTYDLETLRFLVELVGSDRVVVGTDNGFGAKQNFEWPNAIVESLHLPAADQDRILRGNAKKLFRL
jgi:aminocarboxymuconate-semialdehyde decarboxylase